MTEERAVLAGGCFWGMQDLIRTLRRRHLDARRLHGRRRAQRDLSQSRHPCRSDRDHLRSRHDQLPRAAGVLLPDPRSDARAIARATTSGTSYRSAIFYTSDEQKRIAEDTIADVDASGLWPGKVVTEVAPAGDFWEAEPEHQDYLERYPERLHLPFRPAGLEAAGSRKHRSKASVTTCHQSGQSAPGGVVAWQAALVVNGPDRMRLDVGPSPKDRSYVAAATRAGWMMG